MAPGVPEYRNELCSLYTGDHGDWGHGAESQGCGRLVPLLQTVVLLLQVESLNSSAIHMYNHQGMWTDMDTSWSNINNHFPSNEFYWVNKAFFSHQSIEVQTSYADKMPIQRNGKHFLLHLEQLWQACPFLQGWAAALCLSQGEAALFHSRASGKWTVARHSSSTPG